MQASRLGAGNYDDNKVMTIEGGYKASDYMNLPVSADVKELFKSIQRYQKA